MRLFHPIILARGLWLPAALFLIHHIAAIFFHIYTIVPDIDRPFHFLGGFSIAFGTHGMLSELIDRKLITLKPRWLRWPISICSTALFAILWEAYESYLNRVCGILIQTSLDDTLYDLFLGVGGAIGFCVFSAILKILSGRARPVG